MNYQYPMTPFNPYSNPSYNSFNAPQTPTTYPRHEIIKVNGKPGADALQMAPNSSVFVADETKADRIWLCMTDGAGFKTVRAIRAVFEDVEEKSTMANIEERLNKLEATVNEQLNSRSSKSKQSNGKDTAD